ncbi:unnamed protein product, partial [Ectocarpus sp. 4 AP-2014]
GHQRSDRSTGRRGCSGCGRGLGVRRPTLVPLCKQPSSSFDGRRVADSVNIAKSCWRHNTLDVWTVRKNEHLHSRGYGPYFRHLLLGGVSATMRMFHTEETHVLTIFIGHLLALLVRY